MDTHPFFATGDDLTYYWYAAEHPLAGGYPEAIAKLVAGVDRLLAPVFVHVPVDALGNDARWQAVIDATAPLCKCGARRLLVTPMERYRLFADEPPRVVTVSQGSPLYIAPWGGDRESAFVRLEVKLGKLICTPLPFMRRITDPQEMPPFFRKTVARDLSDRVLDFQDIAQDLGWHGELPFAQTAGDIAVVIGAIVAVDTDAMTVDVMLDAGAVQVDHAANEPLHVCATTPAQ